MWELPGKGSHLFDNFPSSVYGAVIDHVHDGHSQVAADAEGDAESQSAHDGNDVPPRQPEAGAVAQRGFLLGHFHGLPILRQLDGVPGLLPLLEDSVRHKKGKSRPGRLKAQQFRGAGGLNPPFPSLEMDLRIYPSLPIHLQAFLGSDLWESRLVIPNSPRQPSAASRGGAPAQDGSSIIKDFCWNM